jgi:hypothetical protein
MSGPRCDAPEKPGAGLTMRCNAQRGHGGDHGIYLASGSPSRSWPRAGGEPLAVTEPLRRNPSALELVKSSAAAKAVTA